ncbi:hypothetical protein D3C84_1088550 [compost metagenome]
MQQLPADVVVDFRGIGGDQVVVAALVLGQFLAQGLVTADQGDLDLDLVAFLELLDQILIGIAGPGEQAQGLVAGVAQGGGQGDAQAQQERA